MKMVLQEMWAGERSPGDGSVLRHDQGESKPSAFMSSAEYPCKCVVKAVVVGEGVGEGLGRRG